MTEYSILLVSRLDPLRYLFDRPVLTGRLMRWIVLLTEFDIKYVTQKSVKGSVVADHLASFPISEDMPIGYDFLDEQFVSVTSITGWLSHPNSRFDPKGGSEPSPGRETIYWDSLPVFFSSELNLYLWVYKQFL